MSDHALDSGSLWLKPLFNFWIEIEDIVITETDYFQLRLMTTSGDTILVLYTGGDGQLDVPLEGGIVLPSLPLARKDIHLDGEKVVAVGWSTGGLLAMSLAWKSADFDIRPPEAVLAFYSPSDYGDPFWTQPNIPEGSEKVFPVEADWDSMVFDRRPITAYNPPASAQAAGGWMSTQDPRSKLALYMNHQGKTLDVLLHGVAALDGHRQVTREEVLAVSPLAKVQQNLYHTPTFIIHPRDDDLIPWQQAERMYEALSEKGVDAELRIIDGGAKHLFDIGKCWEKRCPQGREAVQEGFGFLEKRVCC